MCKSIRNNTEIFILYRNYGDAKTNGRLTNQLDLKKRYLRCLKDASTVKHGYCARDVGIIYAYLIIQVKDKFKFQVTNIPN